MKKQEIRLSDLTVEELLQKNARRLGNKEALIFEGKTYTWQQVEDITDRLALRYLEKGIKKESHVGIFGINSLCWVMSFLALAKIGAVSVLINFNFKYQELLSQVRYADVEYLCYGRGGKEACFVQLAQKLEQEKNCPVRQCIGMEDALSELKIWEEISQEERTLLSEKKAAVASGDFLSMIFTSGTTASPKGVLLSQYQMLNIAVLAAQAMNWDKEDRICLALSLFHCFGLSTGLLVGLTTGCTICILPDFHSKSVLRAVEEWSCTVLNGVPSMFLAIMKKQRLSDYNISTLKSGIIAGSGIRKRDYHQIKEAFGYEKLQQSFGQTETSPSITFSGYDDPDELKAVSVGRGIPYVEIRIANQETGEIQPPQQEGEIQIRGFNVMEQGYYKMPEETKAAFTKDGWLKTGDLGYMDLEENLYITGRKKDVIIRCGENIAPKEIEEAVLEYPGVEDAAAFGLEEEIVQEEIAVCLVSSVPISREELQSFLRERLADYKIPRYVYRWKEFPLHSNGKLNRKALKRAVEERKKEAEK